MLPAALPAYDDLPRNADGVRTAWGLFGADDQLGRLNMQTPERIARAARVVRRGAVFSLNAPLDVISPAMFGRGTPRHSAFERPTGSTDDVIDNFYPQASSQWDALAHACYAPDVFYNGATRAEVLSGRKNTIDRWAERGIAGRAVLLDVQRTATTRYDPGSNHTFTVADLERARTVAAISYEPGDVLLLHTGYLAWYRGQSDTRKAAMAPRDALRSCGLEQSEAMVRYLWDSGFAGIASDNPSVESFPFHLTAFGSLHHVLIPQLGFALGELWDLDALASDCARDGSYEALLVSAPLNLRGGIGSPANALALK
jgi:kynurenine formamidase